MNKEVLAVRREELFGSRNYFEGFMPIELARSSGLERSIKAKGVYTPRAELEGNPEYKQVIIYCALVSDSDKIFSYRRRAGSEKRLSGLWSLGIGGHIYKLESKWDIIRTNVIKRVNEEVDIGSRVMSLRPLGYINCEDSGVNRDHLGLLYLKEVYDEDNIKAKSPKLLEADFRTQSEIEQLIQKHEFEEWSEIAYRVLLREKFKVEE